jgi:hypothetical protein
MMEALDTSDRSLVEVDQRFTGAYCFHHQGVVLSLWWWRHWTPLIDVQLLRDYMEPEIISDRAGNRTSVFQPVAWSVNWVIYHSSERAVKVAVTTLLFACETWCLTIKEEHRSEIWGSHDREFVDCVVFWVVTPCSLVGRYQLRGRTFENKELWKIYGHTRHEVSVLFNGLCRSLNRRIIKVMKWKRLRWAGHVAWMRKTNAYRVLAGKISERGNLFYSQDLYAQWEHLSFVLLKCSPWVGLWQICRPCVLRRWQWHSI